MREARLRYLWSSSQQQQQAGAPALSRVLLHGLDQLLAGQDGKTATALPSRAAQRLCGACFTLLVPGVNCRVTDAVHKRRPAARRRSLRIACDGCGHVSEFPMAAKPSGRSQAVAASAPASAPAVAAPPKKKKKKKLSEAEAAAEAQREAKRKRTAGQLRRVEAATATTAAKSADDGLFGFDFVPL